MKCVWNTKWMDGRGNAIYRMTRFLPGGKHWSIEARIPWTFSRRLKASLIWQMRADFREQMAQLALKPKRS